MGAAREKYPSHAPTPSRRVDHTASIPCAAAFFHWPLSCYRSVQFFRHCLGQKNRRFGSASWSNSCSPNYGIGCGTFTGKPGMGAPGSLGADGPDISGAGMGNGVSFAVDSGARR